MLLRCAEYPLISQAVCLYKCPYFDLSEITNCSGCLDVTLYSEEIARLKQEFEDIQKMLLGQEQVPWTTGELKSSYPIT